MTLQEAGGRHHDGAHSAAATDTAVLRKLLTTSERQIKPHGVRLARDYRAFRDSRGADKHPILTEMSALESAIKGEIRKLKAAKLHTPKGKKAQQLALRTLILTAASVVDLRNAFATSNAARVQAAVKRARQHFKQGQRLKRQTSRALGFTWRL